MSHVIVMGAGYGAVAVVKSLAVHGLQVVLLYSHPHEPACHSRFASQQIRVSNPIDEPDALLRLLIDPQNHWEGSLLIPALDEYAIFVSQNRVKLQEMYVFTMPGWESVRNINNKALLYAHARELGVPVPRIHQINSPAALEECREAIGYPSIIKPSETHKFDRLYGEKVWIVRDFSVLSELYLDAYNNHLEVIISEIIPGEDSKIFSYRSYIDSCGDLLAEMCTQKLRQYPRNFGQGAVVRTVPMIPQIRDNALRLLGTLGYQGESSTEFKFDDRDGQYKLMEINIRPVVTEELFIRAGIDFPYLTYLDMMKDVRKTPLPYREDLYWIHPYWDTINFFQALIAGKLNWMEFLSPYVQKRVFAISFWSDPFHWLRTAVFNSIRAFRKLLRALRRLRA